VASLLSPQIKRLLSYVRPYSFRLSVGVVLVAFVAFAEGLVAFMARIAWDYVLTPTAPSSLLPLFTVPGGRTIYLNEFFPARIHNVWTIFSLALVVVFVSKGVAEYFSTYLMAYIGQSSILSLRQELYSHILSQSASFFERHRTNYLVSRLISSAAAIEAAVTHTLRDMLREGFTLIAFMATSFYVSWRLTLGSLVIAPPVAVLTMRFGRSLRKLARESLEGSKYLTDTAQEALANQSIVKAYSGEVREQTRFTVVAQRLRRANLRSASIAGMSPPIIELIGVLFIAVLLFFGEREIRLGRMDLAQFLLFIVLLLRSYDPMRKLSRLQNAMSQALAAAQHVWEVMDENAAIPEKANPINLAPLRTEIEFRDVHFGYANEARPVLRGVSLTVPAGRMVALVGESGGGKSTLTKLLPRFHDPAKGAVLWDGIDLRDATIASLRKQMALVTQETVLFNDTVRYNITYGKPDATETEIHDAATTALAHDFITQLPEAYDTVIGERGIFLSGGQRQRLAIARAVLVDAPVLILDEATSALDAESEQLVQRAIANLIRNRTTIVIAHRLSTVRRADMIVVMEAGQIIEQGTHAQLLARGGQYQRLYELQFADEEEEVSVVSS